MLSGRVPPDDFHPPEVVEGYLPWVEAFWELSTERRLGFGAVGNIPLSSIRAYTEGWEPWEAKLFHRAIREMDKVYLLGGKEVTPAPAPDPYEKPEALVNPARDNFRAKFKR